MQSRDDKRTSFKGSLTLQTPSKTPSPTPRSRRISNLVIWIGLLNDLFYGRIHTAGSAKVSIPFCCLMKTPLRYRPINEIPRAQLQAIKPTLERIFAKDRDSGIVQGYREQGYRLHDIAAYLGVHYATVSRKLKQIERRKS